ncbi:MAG: MMPL family transporter [Planctomycetaceae bacterium]|nr:MMPL family transporter [Planctomycetaceae bacterium]
MSSELRRHPVLVRISDWLLNWRSWLFLLAVGITLPAIGPANSLKLDEAIESFYSPGDPDLVAWTRSKETFGGDEFVMVAFEQPDLLTAANLASLREFAQQFRDPALFSVEQTYDGKRITPRIDFAATKDLASVLNIDDAPMFSELPRIVRRLVGRVLRESLIDFSRNVLIGEKSPEGAESQTTSVMLRLLPDQSAEERTVTLRRIRELAAAHDPPAHVIGEAVQLNDMFRYVEDDSATLGWWTSALLIIVILAIFRSLRWVILPLLVVRVTIIWTRALLALSGLRLSMVSSMLDSLVTIMVIAVVTHVTVTFREERKTHDRVAAFRESFYRLAPAIFWNCATTAIGFLVLLTSGIVPVRSFAIMMSIGTMIPLVACMLLLPAGILMGKRDADPGESRGEEQLVRSLLGVTHAVERYPWPVVGVSILTIVVAALGITRLTVETDFSKNFRAASPVRQSLDFFESKLGGTGNWEVSFDAPEQLDEAFLDKVRALSADLRRIEMPDGTQLSKVYSLTDGLDFVPTSMGDSIDAKRAALRQLQPDYEAQLYNPAAGRMRIFLRAREQKPAEIKLGLIDEVEHVAQGSFQEARVTGLYVLIARMVSSLLGDQLESFILSTLGISLAMGLAFRGFWIGVASLVPNVIPILLVVGSMGWFGVPINLGTAMIASVSMGLTIDSSIHYLVDYRRARELGMDHNAAIRDTHAGVGRSLVFSNVALMVGFSVLCLSNFIPLIYFGILVSLAMLGGLLGNLVLLPLMLRWVPLRM